MQKLSVSEAVASFLYTNALLQQYNLITSLTVLHYNVTLKCKYI